MRILVPAVLLLAVACGPPGAPPSKPEAAAPERPEVLEPRALALPNGMGAVYFSLRNAGGSDRLLSVSSTAARAAETHETVEKDGFVRMVPHAEGFELPAGGELVLEPGGKHIMLLDLRLEDGARTIPLTLRFERAGAIEIEVPLESMGAVAHGEMDHGEMDHGEMDHGETDHGDMDPGGSDPGGSDPGGSDPGETGSGEMDHGQH